MLINRECCLPFPVMESGGLSPAGGWCSSRQFKLFPL